MKQKQNTAERCKPQAVSKYKTNLKTASDIATITPFEIAPSSVNSYTLLLKEHLRADRINEREDLYINNATGGIHGCNLSL